MPFPYRKVKFWRTAAVVMRRDVLSGTVESWTSFFFDWNDPSFQVPYHPWDDLQIYGSMNDEWLIFFNGFHVGKYTSIYQSDGWYGVCVLVNMYCLGHMLKSCKKKTSPRFSSRGPFVKLRDPLVFQCFGNAPNVFLIILDEKKNQKPFCFWRLWHKFTKNCGESKWRHSQVRWLFRFQGQTKTYTGVARVCVPSILLIRFSVFHGFPWFQVLTSQWVALLLPFWPNASSARSQCRGKLRVSSLPFFTAGNDRGKCWNNSDQKVRLLMIQACLHLMPWYLGKINFWGQTKHWVLV